MPVANERAIELAVTAALALGCEVRRRSEFARKNYFYPDLPKGYQISQYDSPLALGGGVTIEIDGDARRVGLERLHVEEDAGKSIYEGMPQSDRFGYVDLNRAGTPLVEIVSRPEIADPEQAVRFLERLKSILRYTGVSDGNMEEGSLRCDANVSVRPAGARRLGSRVEIKNLNSFRSVRRALEHEIERQERIAAGGCEVERETRAWDEAAGLTRQMRGKETEEDYRYFSEPDLPPLELEQAWIARIAAALPELPGERKRRLIARHALAEADAHLITLDPALADWYEAAATASGNARAAANFVVNDLMRELHAAGDEPGAIPFPPGHLAELIALVERGEISITLARQDLFPEIYRTAERPSAIVERRGLGQIRDAGQLAALVRQALEACPDEAARYRAGKRGLLGFFVGRVMRASGGKADPRLVERLVREALE